LSEEQAPPKQSPPTSSPGSTLVDPKEQARLWYVQNGLTLAEITRRLSGQEGCSYWALWRLANKEDWDTRRANYREKAQREQDRRGAESEGVRLARQSDDLRRAQKICTRLLDYSELLLDEVPEGRVPSPGVLIALADATSKAFATMERALRLEREIAPQGSDPLGEVWAAASALYKDREAQRQAIRDELQKSDAGKRLREAIESKANGSGRVHDNAPAKPRRGGPKPPDPPKPPQVEPPPKPRRRVRPPKWGF
jgi:hypothetical protein